MYKQLGIITLIALLTTNLLAQNDRKFSVDAPSVVRAGESFQVRYILENPKSRSPKILVEKNVDGLSYYGSTSYTSRQSSVTIVNGKLKAVSKNVISWIYTFVADQPGEYTIPPAKVIDGGDQLTSNPVTIRVEKPYNNQLPKPKVATGTQDQEYVPKQNKNLFIDLVASKRNVYVGEPVYLYARIYSTYQLSIDDFEPAKFPGFWVQEIDMPSRIQAERVTVNGKQYLAATLDKRVLFPQETGDLKISPYKLSVTLYDRMGFPFNRDVQSNSLTIHVKPLPVENKPANFSGAVGNFNMSVELDKDSVNVDEPVTIKITVSGVGNFGLFDIPEPSVPNSFEVLEPKTIPQYKATEAGMEGRITKEFIYIPRSTGKYTIPEIKFSFFNPYKKKYITLSSKPLNISIYGTHDSTGAVFNSYKSDVTQLGNDINYIETTPFKLKPKEKFFAGSRIHWLSYILALILFGILSFIERKKIKERSDIRKFKSKIASKTSYKRLKVARKMMKAGNSERFYEEVAKALWDYLGNKLNINTADLTRDRAKEELSAKGVPQELINEFIEIIDNCDFARYAQTGHNGSMEEIYNRASKLIDKLENIL